MFSRTVSGSCAHQCQDRSFATRERQQAREHFDDGGFSAAIGTEKPKDFAFLDAEAGVIHGREAAEPANEILCGDSGLFEIAHGSAPRRQRNVGGHAGADAMRRVVNAHQQPNSAAQCADAWKSASTRSWRPEGAH